MGCEESLEREEITVIAAVQEKYVAFATTGTCHRGAACRNKHSQVFNRIGRYYDGSVDDDEEGGGSLWEPRRDDFKPLKMDGPAAVNIRSSSHSS